ncbi:hypothetical protein PC9H_008485 [Pleurotus ostreatus]|uniref:Uncharacterized protein n=1 Tax=Pleurotus ostreatus TaxID=5322 RepID=A0A8H7DP06_PLEOS|nr:uncharacterized protein PC9H_008485 [Pleurotus ostreatus]KAF7426119.1 hypothetical protein PC9H_008485 [Pleurotus ostreatus]
MPQASKKLFFAALDHELEKIEAFYEKQEKALQEHTQMLKEQLNELAEHRKQFYEAFPEHKQTLASALKQYQSGLRWRLRLGKAKQNGLEQTVELSSAQPPSMERPTTSGTAFSNDDSDNAGPSKGNALDASSRLLAPDEYHHAKKKLRKAVVEHYRALEALKNYRILNITGFRKALKKFEKFTKIPVQHAYMAEKVETSAFYSDKAVNAMIEEMEGVYTLRFEQGDRKKARARLRGSGKTKSHHFSTFRSGILLGLALPALVSGIYHSFLQETRDEIPGWDALLFVYGMLLIPVLFSLLVGLNLLVWSRSRINYVFIFGLPPGLTTVWPLAWLGFVGLVFFQPFPFLFKPSRFWLLRKIGRLLMSGTRRVEFADFWMGDQFCSLFFTLSNLYLFACVYARGFDDQWRRCGTSSPNWPAAFALGILPFVVRVVQSLRRYADSKLPTHLVNGGKYASGIVSYFFYFLWRHNGSRASLALWCVSSIVYAIYASSWDLLMDWSILRFKSDGRFPFLRPELVYSESIPFYYFAIVSNVLLRFVWVFYIPSRGPNIMLRTFIAGILEMLRRWQWNFYRLENEHLGNVDQYRITREVPLPYSFDEASQDDDNDESDAQAGVASSRMAWLFYRKRQSEQNTNSDSN